MSNSNTPHAFDYTWTQSRPMIELPPPPVVRPCDVRTVRVEKPAESDLFGTFLVLVIIALGLTLAFTTFQRAAGTPKAHEPAQVVREARRPLVLAAPVATERADHRNAVSKRRVGRRVAAH